MTPSAFCQVQDDVVDIANFLVRVIDFDGSPIGPIGNPRRKKGHGWRAFRKLASDRRSEKPPASRRFMKLNSRSKS
jgi:hypothetical protein